MADNVCLHWKLHFRELCENKEFPAVTLSLSSFIAHSANASHFYEWKTHKEFKSSLHYLMKGF
jgi:hypothetical protein